MKPITLQEICQATGGTFAPSPGVPGEGGKEHVSPGVTVAAVCTDSRRMSAGSLFIALRGERFDAHDFLPVAAAGGAVAALIDHRPPHCPQGMPLIQVADTRKAMGKLAAFIRRGLGSKVIGVVGSNGKTGTKNLIDAALRTLAGTISPKSFNNDVGVPIAIFAADAAHDYLVLEMGTNHPGEIAVLAEIAQPDVAVITNCTAEHLEGLRDLETVRRENSSVIDRLTGGGLLVVNGDDALLLQATARHSGQRVTFGLGQTNDLFATDVRCDLSGTRFRLCGREEIALPLLGRHMACNALAAIAVGREMGLGLPAIIENLAWAKGPDMRLQLQEAGGVRILNDAYNANPASMRAGLETLAALPAAGRRIAVLGDMRELGDASRRYHEEAGKLVGTLAGIDELICVGTESRFIAQAAVSAGMAAQRVTVCTDAAAAARAVPAMVAAGDLVLLKGSRAMRLETIATAIAARRTGPTPSLGANLAKAVC